MSKLFFKYLVLIFFISTKFILSQNKSIEVLIIDGETHSPIEQVEIKITELNKSYITGKNGITYFGLTESESYSFQIQRIGYKSLKINISKDDLLSKPKQVFYLFAIPIQTGTIIIKGEHDNLSLDENISQKNILYGSELQRDLSSTLASTLKNELGIAMRSMGPAPSRPVLRGLGGDRIIISEDGVKNNDLSATSPDHAVTIEPFTIDRIEIIRGPQVLLSSSVANGGIVQVVRNEIILNPVSNINGNTGLYYESANKGLMGSANLVLPLNNFAFRGEFSKKSAGDINSPIGILKNSAFEVLNYSMSTSYNQNNFSVGVSTREYNTNYQIPGGFVGAHPNGVDIDVTKMQNQFKSKYNFSNSILSELKLNASQLFLRQKEFEKKGLIGADFVVNNNILNFELSHNEYKFLSNGIISMSLENREIEIGGFVFTPSTKMQNLALAIFETYKNDYFIMQFGARSEFANVLPSNDVFLNPKKYFNISAFAISMLHYFSEKSHLGLNFSKSGRIPTIEELYSKGPHLAAYSYEIGNVNLTVEKSIGLETYYHYDSEKSSFIASIFTNYFSNFIIPRNTGKTNWATLLPIYQTSQVGAMLSGIELEIKNNFNNVINLSVDLSYTNGVFTENNKPLPSIPPLKINSGAQFKFDDFNFGIENETALKQNKVDEFELPTNGYSIFNFYAQYVFVKELNIYNFSLNVENAFNGIYYNHLSRIKSIMPEAGRNVKFITRIYF